MRSKAKKELENNRIPKLEIIKDRFEVSEAKYPAVKFGKECIRIEDEDFYIFPNM